jgi:hypothetical protein
LGKTALPGEDQALLKAISNEIMKTQSKWNIEPSGLGYQVGEKTTKNSSAFMRLTA